MNKYRVMLTINGKIRGHHTEAPRSTWRYAIFELKPNESTGYLVAEEIVEGGFKTRAEAESRRKKLEAAAKQETGIEPWPGSGTTAPE